MWLTSACNSFPFSVSTKNGRLNTTDWRMDVPFSIQMTFFQRRASTVYNRFNFTIQDVTFTPDPSLVVCTPNNFFGFCDLILAIGNETDLQPDYSVRLLDYSVQVFIV